MTSRPDWQALAPFLELAGADPRADPARFDVLQREIAAAWNRGESMRAWAERVRAEKRSAGEDPPGGPLSWPEAMAQLRRRYASP